MLLINIVLSWACTITWDNYIMSLQIGTNGDMGSDVSVSRYNDMTQLEDDGSELCALISPYLSLLIP